MKIVHEDTPGHLRYTIHAVPDRVLQDQMNSVLRVFVSSNESR